MENNEILKIFYDEIVNEALVGRVDSYVKTNIIFSLTIDNKKVTKVNEEKLEYNGILVPTLKVTNKELFDKLLLIYVKKALLFYDEKDFIEEIRNDEKNKIKYIMGVLWGNASVDDFSNPINFLESRINMFDNKILDTKEEVCLGNINSLNAKLMVKEEKSNIVNETPYVIKGYLEFNDGNVLYLPKVFIGDSGKNYTVYAIQNEKETVDNDICQKKIRSLIPAKIKGSKESFFVAAMLSLNLCKDKEILLNPFLIERWNSKRIANYYRKDKSLEELENKQISIQKNLTDSFIRLYSKLINYSDGITINSVPFDMDDKMHITINENAKCNIEVFDEILNIEKENIKQK